MLRTLLICLLVSIAAPATAENAPSKSGTTAFQVAKLFFAARAAVGERTAFTDDPTSPTISKPALLDSVKLSFERTAGSKLDTVSDPLVANMWKAINTVIDRAMAGGYKGKWADHPNFPGKLIPARFGSEVTAEYNASVPNSRIKWTTSNEYLVNPKSQADDWELGTINSRFKSGAWKQGDAFSETLRENGHVVFRYAQPEYFKSACMNCHGGEMGKIIHKGKGVAGSGTFGGMLSVRIND